jgi:hypothetical protein
VRRKWSGGQGNGAGGACGVDVEDPGPAAYAGAAQRLFHRPADGPAVAVDDREQ